MASSMMEFELILNVMSDVTEKNLLIIFNKQDRHNEITDKQFIEGFFNLDELLEQYPNLNVIYASALKGLNCQEIYTWVTNVLTGKIITQVKKKKTQCGCFF
ncbi:UNKNOWN [Stylonychia lemnae]|uniref:Uncharacterized protein n=1 Tax=Stylonychia lemnae TaxID=5949 RepID=A0A078A474_STYLE|nr:UNKNOWN [Stylonychia lemnae]|eukprot:CDW76689.1 UNKNOWN [Stylonychia lemnae]